MSSQFYKVCSGVLMVCCTLAPFSSSVAGVSTSTELQNLNFNYKITGEGPSGWKPVEVFSSGNKTYIKYSSVSGEHDLPDLYLKSDGQGIPKWKWKSPYVVVDARISSAQVVSPHTGKVLYQIDQKENALPYIPPAPKLRAERMAGAFIELNGGIGGVDNQKFKNPVVNISIGYDGALSDHWLLGIGVGGTYNGKSNSGMLSNGSTGKIQSYDNEILGRATYLFYNGFKIFGKAGLAYAMNKAVNTTGPEPNQMKKIVPKMAIGIGYQTTVGVGFNFQFSRLFDSNSTVNANALTVGIGYHF